MKTNFGWAIASVISIAGLGSAMAADMPLKAPPPVVVAYSWTGCYIGINGGGKWGRFGESARAPGGTSQIPGVAPVTFAADSLNNLDRVTSDSGVIGGQAGCRWQTPQNWVFGFEGDADWHNLRGTTTALTTNGSIFVPGDFFNNRSRWQGSIRGTAGRAFDRVLVYVTAGVAFADVSMDGNFIPVVTNGIPFPGSFGGSSNTLVGGTVGVGVLYALAKNWEIGAEYKYAAYDGKDFGLGSVAAICGRTTQVAGGVGCFNVPVTGHKDLQTSEVLVKLNYRFDLLGTPVAAKY